MLKPLIIKAVLLAAAVSSLSTLALEARAESTDEVAKARLALPLK